MKSVTGPTIPVTFTTQGAGKATEFGPGGWAYVWRQGADMGHNYGSCLGATNNVAALVAVIKAMESVENRRTCPITVQTDSEYVVKGASLWLPRWKTNGWRNIAGDNVSNREFWESLDHLSEGLAVQWRWIRRESTPDHQLAVRLARAAIVQRQTQAGQIPRSVAA